MLQRFRHLGPFSSVSVLAVALLALILLPGTASGAGRTSPASATWGVGTEAVLPADAATTSQNVSVNSISCASAGNCSAVGTYLDGSGNTQGLLLTETAGTWATGHTAALPANAATTNQFVHLGSVSCASAGNCTAVGSYADNSGNGQGLLLTQTSGTWAVGSEVTVPANAGTNPSASVGSVSCPSAGNCSAVGSYRTSSGNNLEALVLTETAGSWSTGIELSLPADAATSNQLAALYSVSCPSAGNCAAVGGYQFMSGPDSWASQGLMVSETAGSWGTGVGASLPANAWTPNPQAGLSSVSCASVGNCTAVGNYSNNTPTSQGLLLTESGGTWATGVAAPLPANAETSAPGPLGGIGSVSCASAGNCTAVGEYYNSSGNGEGLLLTETAGSWATGVEAVLPADAATTQQSVGLSSVSCPTAGNCSAVGSYNVDSAEGAGLLLTETSGTWGPGTEVALPPNGSSAPTPVSINSISCPSAGQCGAAGWYGVTSPGGGNEGLLVSTTTTAPLATLTVSSTGPGAGAVTSSPAGIDCGATCTFKFELGSVVTLTPTPGAHSFFSGWSTGSCDGSIGPCQVTMSGDQTATATFDLNSYLVTVQKAGPGSGTVVSTTPDAELDCGPNCAIAFRWGSQVTLIATPDNGSVFEGWSGGGCSGTSGCAFTVSADTAVTATFGKVQCVVPKVKGKTLSGAKASIYAAYCNVGKVRKVVSKKVRKGRVISQSPSPGRQLARGSKVNLVVSKGR